MMTAFRRRLAWADKNFEGKSLHDILTLLHEQGRLNDESISDSIAMKDTEFTSAAIAYLTKFPIPVVERIIASQNPRAVTALAWKAGLSMRLAMIIQKAISNINERDLLRIRGKSAFPIPEVEMEDILKSFLN
jgi:uncharacterized protein (DUF2336 family)